MSKRPWHGLALSLALHAGVLAVVLVAISRDETLPALMIDLREPFVPGAASVASPPREERLARSGTPARAKRSKATGEKTTVDAAAPSPPGPSAPAAPALPPAIVVEAPPSPPALTVTTEPSREAAPPSPPPSRETVEARPLGAAAKANEPAPRVESAVPSAGGVDVTSGDRGIVGGASTALGRRAIGQDEAGDSAAPRVASVPPGGAGSGAGAEYGPYLTALRERIQHSVHYPASARRRGLGGTVSVEILILANGSIADVTLLESSTHAVLDDAALDTIRSLPRMPLPPELPARPLRVRVPVVFQMR